MSSAGLNFGNFASGFGDGLGRGAMAASTIQEIQDRKTTRAARAEQMKMQAQESKMKLNQLDQQIEVPAIEAALKGDTNSALHGIKQTTYGDQVEAIEVGKDGSVTAVGPKLRTTFEKGYIDMVKARQAQSIDPEIMRDERRAQLKGKQDMASEQYKTLFQASKGATPGTLGKAQADAELAAFEAERDGKKLTPEDRRQLMLSTLDENLGLAQAKETGGLKGMVTPNENTDQILEAKKQIESLGIQEEEVAPGDKAAAGIKATTGKTVDAPTGDGTTKSKSMDTATAVKQAMIEMKITGKYSDLPDDKKAKILARAKKLTMGE
jgi:hypothetical protein